MFEEAHGTYRKSSLHSLNQSFICSSPAPVVQVQVTSEDENYGQNHAYKDGNPEVTIPSS